MSDIPFSLNTIAAMISIALGLLGLFAPYFVAELVGIVADDPRGVSEVRATYGGMFIGFGVAALIAQDRAAFVTLGCGWLGAAVARVFAMYRDQAMSGANAGAVIMEAVIGAMFLFGPGK
ncbi:MAG: hypothetical protein ACI8TX_001580 [Hyphomicrobiaceae bacterium]|jgi:hypothetical protein